MPRDLSDVLHYFIPEADPPARDETAQQATPAPRCLAPSSPDDPPGDGWRSVPVAPQAPSPDDAEPRNVSPGAALPIVAVPIEDDEPVRAALLWNLAVEVARRGGRGQLLVPERSTAGAAWPAPGRQPLGAELVVRPARDLGELYRAAVELALGGTPAAEGGLVLVHVPPAWLAAPGDGAALLEWALLLTRSDASDLRATWRLAKALLAARPDARLGVTIHGATSRESAERGFASLARAARERLGRDLASYGLLTDDLSVYRAGTAQRPIGLTHPQSLAARALHDVAGILLEDARDLEPR